jgi:hypothetical protein
VIAERQVSSGASLTVIPLRSARAILFRSCMNAEPRRLNVSSRSA